MKMKTNFTIALLIALFTTSSLFAMPNFGHSIKINDNWQFQLNNAVTCPTSGWQNIHLPHDWTIKQPYSNTNASATGFLAGGIGWYKKNIDIPNYNTDKNTFLYFEGVYNNSQVFVNDSLIGERPNGYVSFWYNITPFIKEGQTNTIAVRVDHSNDADSRWYTGSGIYRDVYLVTTGKTYLEPWSTFATATNIANNSATINIQTSPINQTNTAQKIEIKYTIKDLQQNKIIAGTTTKAKIGVGQDTLRTAIKIKNPKIWSLENPSLYQINAKLYLNGEESENFTFNVGIRSLRFDANHGFFLNEKATKLKGVCIHHDGGVLGSAITKEVWRYRLEQLKTIGVNAIRTSHNPHAPYLYDLCDELGLLVMDEAFDEWEFPKKKWIDGWNLGKPGYQGYAEHFADWADKDLESMILRDRNHPSIIMWSIGNEVDYPNDPYTHMVLDTAHINQPMYGGFLKNHPNAERLGVIATRLAKVARTCDTTRPVTAALAGVVMSNHTTYPSAVDITGYNYTENRYDIDHNKYPNRIIYGSETSSTYDAWVAARDREFIAGQFIWTGIDYLGESREWPTRGFYSGLLNFSGKCKPRGEFRKSLWSDQPMAYLGTSPTTYRGNEMDVWPHWNYSNGDTVDVSCFTNGAKARLFLNGTQIGSTKPYDNTNGIIRWRVPYQAGTLTVESLNSADSIIATYSISTPGTPERIKAQAYKTTLSKDREVTLVFIEIVDENGRTDYTSAHTLNFITSKGLKVLGIENSNNTDISDQTDTEHSVYHGEAVVYIETTGTMGEASLKITSPELKEAELIFKIE